MSMVDGFLYTEEVGGSNPSAPTRMQRSENAEVRDQRSEVRYYVVTDL